MRKLLVLLRSAPLTSVLLMWKIETPAIWCDLSPGKQRDEERPDRRAALCVWHRNQIKGINTPASPRLFSLRWYSVDQITERNFFRLLLLVAASQSIKQLGFWRPAYDEILQLFACAPLVWISVNFLIKFSLLCLKEKITPTGKLILNWRIINIALSLSAQKSANRHENLCVYINPLK